MYTQFTKETRIELATLLRAQHSFKDCAKELGMLKCSVTREVGRNADENGRYTGAAAHQKYCERRTQAKISSVKIQNDASLRRYIRLRLMKRDSPEQIAAAVKDILGNPDHTQAVTENAYRLVAEKYDWSLIARGMREKVFSRLFL